eukprot:SAG22_NODE_262_length_13373_cov_11.716965_7_plen_269_part_00
MAELTAPPRSCSFCSIAQDRTYTAPATLAGGHGQVWVADSHLPGFARPWFNLLAWGNSQQPMHLTANDFYSEARWDGAGSNATAAGAADGGSSRWDGLLTGHFVWDWRNPCVRTGAATSCPGAFVAAGGSAGVTIPAAGGRGGDGGGAQNDRHQPQQQQAKPKPKEVEEAFLQLAPVLSMSSGSDDGAADPTILLGETTKFVPFSPKRFTALTKAAATTGWSLKLAGRPGEVVTVTCATPAGRLHRTQATVGADGTCTVALDPSSMWA